YLIPSRTWRTKLKAGYTLPATTKLAEANAIGYTTSGDEQWGSTELKVQVVGLAPYAGRLIPRVVGILTLPETIIAKDLDIDLVKGNALEPRGNGIKLIAHIVPDSTMTWGGGGFASQLRKKYPQVVEQFKEAVGKTPE